MAEEVLGWATILITYRCSGKTKADQSHSDGETPQKNNAADTLRVVQTVVRVSWMIMPDEKLEAPQFRISGGRDKSV